MFLLGFKARATYYTPGTGNKYQLTDLTTQSNGDVIYSSGIFWVNSAIFISPGDTLEILTDETVKFAAATTLDVNGVLLIDPPNQVFFTAQNTTSGFTGVRIDSSSATVIRNLTFEYGNTLRIFDCKPLIDSCRFQYNSIGTTLGSSAISLFRGSPVISNSVFINNNRAAITSSVSNNNAPKIINNLFQGNNTILQNVPQINLGPSGADTTRIINNKILSAATTSSGGLALTSFATLNAVITQNTIKHNRYGMTVYGSNLVNAMISYNVIDSNTSEGNAATGGSGLALYGSSAATPSLQHVIVKGNSIRGNLWGITLLTGAQPNLGNLNNIDTSDDGKNEFYDNTNTTTPGIDLYNNTSFSISAENNFWNTSSAVIVEDRIYHQADDATLGWVDFHPIGGAPLPLRLISFSGKWAGENVNLTWETASERCIERFEIERSGDARLYEYAGEVKVESPCKAKAYSFDDNNSYVKKPNVYYRLKMVDRDGSFSYSDVVKMSFTALSPGNIEVFPTLLHREKELTIRTKNEQRERVVITIVDGAGRIILTNAYDAAEGANIFTVPSSEIAAAGRLYVKITMGNKLKTVPVFVGE